MSPFSRAASCRVGRRGGRAICSGGLARAWVSRSDLSIRTRRRNRLLWERAARSKHVRRVEVGVETRGSESGPVLARRWHVRVRPSQREHPTPAQPGIRVSFISRMSFSLSFSRSAILISTCAVLARISLIFLRVSASQESVSDRRLEFARGTHPRSGTSASPLRNIIRRRRWQGRRGRPCARIGCGSGRWGRCARGRGRRNDCSTKGPDRELSAQKLKHRSSSSDGVYRRWAVLCEESTELVPFSL